MNRSLVAAEALLDSYCVHLCGIKKDLRNSLVVVVLT